MPTSAKHEASHIPPEGDPEVFLAVCLGAELVLRCNGRCQCSRSVQLACVSIVSNLTRLLSDIVSTLASESLNVVLNDC